MKKEMKGTKAGRARRTLVILLAVSMAFTFGTSSSFASSFGATFYKSGNLPGATVNADKFYSTQGIAFDTYTHKDAYVVTLSSVNKKNAQVAHMRYNNGKWSIVKKVVYKNGILGHANDLTVYKHGKVSHLIIAMGGDGHKTACMINLAEFNKGKAAVHKVKFKKLDRASGSDLRGITYCGNMKVKIKKKTVKKPVFLVETGRRINKVYLESINNKTATFAWVDSQRIKAPMYHGHEGTANGITYHKGYIYCGYGDEGKGGQNKTAMIERTKMASLFKNANSNKAIKFSQSWIHSYDDIFTIEDICFFSLEGKSNMFITCNGGSGTNHKDYIYKSTQVF